MLKDILNARRMTTKELAEKTEIPYRTLENYRMERRAISLMNGAKIAKSLDIDIEDLIHEEPVEIAERMKKKLINKEYTLSELDDYMEEKGCPLEICYFSSEELKEIIESGSMCWQVDDAGDHHYVVSFKVIQIYEDEDYDSASLLIQDVQYR